MEVNGAVMVYFDAEGRPPAWQPPAIATPAMRFHGSTQHLLRAHVSVRAAVSERR
jgi:hypothetical protein